MNLFLLQTKLKSGYPVVRKPVDPHPQTAAVLIILYSRNNKTRVLMIKRSWDLKVHPGEIGFPGGTYKEEDGDLLVTAIRETREEVGIEVPESDIFAQLPVVETRLEFRITPFVAILSTVPALDPEKTSDEVEELLEIPLTPLLTTQQRDVGVKSHEGGVVYWFDHHRIWGASAKILQCIENLSGH